MSALAQRLAALQRQAGIVPPLPLAGEGWGEGGNAIPPSSGPAGHLLPPAGEGKSASTHLDHLRQLLGARAARVAPLPRAFDRDLPGCEIAPGLQRHEQRMAWLQAPATVPVHALARAAAPEPEIARERFKCFDTETTGLAGGTGTRAFQIGVGDWHDGAFRVRQLTLTTLAAETAMLDEFARWLRPDDVLVSYNGKSYDAPLLATRYRLARRRSPLLGLPHLDLLYPVRRRYRGHWPNCRLATVERELLGVLREHDLPGSEAPRAWLEYLRGGSAVDLRRVGEHNRQDLRSLALLLCRLTDGSGVVPVG